jgi:hypothetical protein
MTMPKMDACTACMICEGEYEASREEQIEAWQSLIDDGTVWKLQGSYGRNATNLINAGICHARKGA